MKKTKIVSGNFATGKDANGKDKKGNFSGYNVKGERVFINKKQMEAIGIKTDADVKPFYAVVGEREIDTMDADGNATGVKTLRLQALSVFTTEADLISAVNADDLLEINAKAALKAHATTAGLSEAAVEALLSATI